MDKLLELKKCITKEYLDSFESDFMERFKEENFIWLVINSVSAKKK